MSKHAIQSAIDALQRTEAAGFSNWSFYRREALAKLHQAYDDYEYQLSIARTKGLVAACTFFTVVNAISVAVLAWYMGWM